MNQYFLRPDYRERLEYLRYVGWLLDSLIDVISARLELIVTGKRTRALKPLTFCHNCGKLNNLTCPVNEYMVL